MSDIDRILELLEKDDLSPEEKGELDGLKESYPGTENFIKTYSGLKKSFNSSTHIDELILGEYVLFKNQVPEDEKSISLLEKKIEDHLRTCDQCMTVFKELNAEYSEVDSFLSESLTEADQKEKSRVLTTGFFQKITPPRFLFASIITLIVAYVGMFSASAIFTPDYKKSAISQDERDLYNTRGRTSELFQKSLNAIDKNEFDIAIGLLKEDVEKNADEPSIFYSHFILGVTYIQSSESSFLGTFKSFDNSKLADGIEHLQKSITLNRSGRYNNLNLDAHYFIGKAYLLSNSENQAIEHLRVVVENKGSYYKKAQALLDKIGVR